jgi:hypothetical protein
MGRIAAVVALGAAWLMGSAVEARAGHAPPATHSMALDSVAAVVASDLLRDAPIPSGRAVILTSPAPGDTLSLLTQRLVGELRGRQVPVRLMAPGTAITEEPDTTLVRAEGGGHPLRLNLQVDGAGVSYVKRLGKFPFGTKGYERLAAMRATATLIDPIGGEVFWTRSSTHSATDVVSKGDVAYAASGSGRLNPPVPKGGGTHWLEPLIVVGVVAGLVVLFYSNRN